jgi:hypothetical protein
MTTVAASDWAVEMLAEAGLTDTAGVTLTGVVIVTDVVPLAAL